MVPFLLLLAGSPSGQSVALPRLTPACTVTTCPPVHKRSPYRLAQDNPMPIDSRSRPVSSSIT